MNVELKVRLPYDILLANYEELELWEGK